MLTLQFSANKLILGVVFLLFASEPTLSCLFPVKVHLTTPSLRFNMLGRVLNLVA